LVARRWLRRRTNRWTVFTLAAATAAGTAFYVAIMWLLETLRC